MLHELGQVTRIHQNFLLHKVQLLPMDHRNLNRNPNKYDLNDEPTCYSFCFPFDSNENDLMNSSHDEST